MGLRHCVMLVAISSASCASFGAASDPPALGDAGGDGPAREATASADAGGDAGTGDGGTDGGACPWLRCVTFEDGFAGLDVTGAPTLEKQNPIKGLQSMAVASGTTYVSLPLLGEPEVWLSLYLRAGQVLSNATPLALLANGAPALRITASGLTLGISGDGLASGNLSTTFTPGTVYRLGIHVKAVTNSFEVEAWLASGDAAFGARIFAGVAMTKAIPDTLRAGAADSAVVDATLDDIVISKTGLPGPL